MSTCIDKGSIELLVCFTLNIDVNRPFGSLLEAQFIIDIDTLISDASRSYCDRFINIYEGSSIDKVELSK